MADPGMKGRPHAARRRTAAYRALRLTGRPLGDKIQALHRGMDPDLVSQGIQSLNMRLLFTSDLHGSDSHYARLITAVGAVKPDVVVLGGDLLPDDSALDPDMLGRGQPEFVRNQFRKYIGELRRHSTCKDVLVIFGNHDWGSSVTAMDELAREGLVRVLDHQNSQQVGGVCFLGYSYTPPTPWFVKDFERLDMRGDEPPLIGGARWDHRFSRMVQHSSKYIFDGAPTIGDDLGAVQSPAEPWVFVIHAPPYGSKLDQAFGNHSWGSRSVRQALERLQPQLSLHGHIHESPVVSGSFQDTIGRTVALNPGQTSAELCYATIDMDVAHRKVTKLEHGRQI